MGKSRDKGGRMSGSTFAIFIYDNQRINTFRLKSIDKIEILASPLRYCGEKGYYAAFCPMRIYRRSSWKPAYYAHNDVYVSGRPSIQPIYCYPKCTPFPGGTPLAKFLSSCLSAPGLAFEIHQPLRAIVRFSLSAPFQHRVISMSNQLNSSFSPATTTQ